MVMPMPDFTLAIEQLEWLINADMELRHDAVYHERAHAQRLYRPEARRTIRSYVAAVRVLRRENAR